MVDVREIVPANIVVQPKVGVIDTKEFANANNNNNNNNNNVIYSNSVMTEANCNSNAETNRSNSGGGGGEGGVGEGGGVGGGKSTPGVNIVVLDGDDLKKQLRDSSENKKNSCKSVNISIMGELGVEEDDDEEYEDDEKVAYMS